MVLTEYAVAPVSRVPNPVDACQIYHALRIAPEIRHEGLCWPITSHSVCYF